MKSRQTRHSIPYKQFTFKLIAKEPLILPPYKGSTLRGGFGNALRKTVCTLRKNNCHDCLLKEKCVYSYIFETPPPSDTKIMRKYETAPHPFIIEPPAERRRGYKPDNEITFKLTLIGKAIDYLPYFIYTFDELGKIGIGKGRGKYKLKEALAGGRKIYSHKTKTLKSFSISKITIPMPLNTRGSKTNTLTLKFLTPTRIVYSGRLTLDLEFHVLIRNLLRRVALIYYFHAGGDPSDWQFNEIISMAKDINVREKNLRWHDWARYSTRQDTRMKMGGFVGEITFEGNITPFMPLLKAGEVLHIGKGTSFGLGKYEIG
jgi:CRISPR-associated endoribonuclease Cas6